MGHVRICGSPGRQLPGRPGGRASAPGDGSTTYQPGRVIRYGTAAPGRSTDMNSAQVLARGHLSDWSLTRTVRLYFLIAGRTTSVTGLAGRLASVFAFPFGPSTGTWACPRTASVYSPGGVPFDTSNDIVASALLSAIIT